MISDVLDLINTLQDKYDTEGWAGVMKYARDTWNGHCFVMPWGNTYLLEDRKLYRSFDNMLIIVHQF